MASQAANNLGVVCWNNGDVQRWRELISESRRLAQRVGEVQGTRWAQTGFVTEDFMRGRWQQALAGADEFIGMCETGKPHYMESSARNVRAEMRIAQGDLDGGSRRRRALTPSCSGGQGPPEPHTVAEVRRSRRTRRSAVSTRPGVWPVNCFHSRGRTRRRTSSTTTRSGRVAKLGIVAEVRELYERARPTPWRDAELAVLSGEFATAAQMYADVGYLAIEAEVRVLAAEELIETGRHAEAEEQARKAIAFYETVGASYYIERLETLLREAEAV